MNKYRIIVSNEPNGRRQYYLMVKRFFGWKMTCGYHRGEQFAYEYNSAGNPWYLLEYTIPEIEKERQFPILSRERVCEMRLKRPRWKPKALGEVDVDRAEIILGKHFIEHGKVMPNRYPSREAIPWIWNKENNDERS